jgi:hypothetical protein
MAGRLLGRRIGSGGGAERFGGGELALAGGTDLRAAAIAALASSATVNAGWRSMPSRHTSVAEGSFPLDRAALSSSVPMVCSTPCSSVKRHGPLNETSPGGPV